MGHVLDMYSDYWLGKEVPGEDMSIVDTLAHGFCRGRLEDLNFTGDSMGVVGALAEAV